MGGGVAGPASPLLYPLPRGGGARPWVGSGIVLVRAALAFLRPSGHGFIAPRAGLHGGVCAVFVQQFAPAVQAGGVKRACFNRGLHGTARFVLVGAIAKTAKGGKFGNLRKQAVDA